MFRKVSLLPSSGEYKPILLDSYVYGREQPYMGPDDELKKPNFQKVFALKAEMMDKFQNNFLNQEKTIIFAV
jgi:hypothetical protein